MVKFIIIGLEGRKRGIFRLRLLVKKIIYNVEFCVWLSYFVLNN